MVPASGMQENVGGLSAERSDAGVLPRQEQVADPMCPHCAKHQAQSAAGPGGRARSNFVPRHAA